MKGFFQVLGTGTGDMSPSGLLFFDQARYLFNCGEGSQRFFTQCQIKLTRLSSVFLTRLTWDHIGGLPGYLLSAADGGAGFMRIIGPRYTKHFMASLRPFVQRKHFPLSILEVKDGDSFQLDNMKVQVMELYSNKFGVSASAIVEDKLNIADSFLSRMFKVFDIFAPPKSFNVNEQDEETIIQPMACSSEEFHVDENSLASDDRELPLPPLNHASLCFLVSGPSSPGKFYVEKANALGVPISLRSQLVKGNSIQLPSGQFVHPSDCVGKDLPGSLVLYMDVPSVEYLESLYSKSSFATMPGKIELVIHQLGPGVVLEKSYLLWFQRNPCFSSATHIIIAPHEFSDQRIVFKSSAVLSHYLHRMNGEAFTSYWYKNEAKFPHFLESKMNVFIGEPLLCYHLEGKKPGYIDHSLVLKKINANELVPSDKPFLSVPPKVPFVLEEKESKNYDISYRMIVLGSGSAIPSKYRNVSSVHLEFPSSDGTYFGLLLDAGEGTFGQLLRSSLGPADVDNKIKNLKIIYISHLHADHHLGLLKILQTRKKLGVLDSLCIIGPGRYQRFLKECAALMEICPYQFFHSEYLFPRGNTFDEDCSRELDRIATPLSLSLRTVAVDHSPSSYALILRRYGNMDSNAKNSQPWKLVYSGDTRPCMELLGPGLNADLLIHEATFSDSENGPLEAIKKKHSTWGEAISLAVEMKAKHVLLVHFSQRHPIAPELPLSAITSNTKVIIACDFLRLNSQTLSQCNIFQQSLSNLACFWRPGHRDNNSLINVHS